MKFPTKILKFLNGGAGEGSADENSVQNFNQGGENSKLDSNENSADGARRDR